MAVMAYVLITTEGKETKRVLEALRQADFVQSAHAVSGPYDLVAVVEAESVDRLGQLLTETVHNVSGIERTLTSIVLNI